MELGLNSDISFYFIRVREKYTIEYHLIKDDNRLKVCK
jgi:hypothetical protein